VAWHGFLVASAFLESGRDGELRGPPRTCHRSRWGGSDGVLDLY
jgi:hypothetical protein